MNKMYHNILFIIIKELLLKLNFNFLGTLSIRRKFAIFKLQAVFLSLKIED